MKTPEPKQSPKELLKKKTPPNARSVESLAHFHCAHCGKWWSIGDAPQKKTLWHCPWCGIAQKIT